MNPLKCFQEKTSAFIIGTILLLLGFLFVIVGFTVLPLFGVLVAIPLFLISIPFLKDAFKAACDYYGL